MRRLMQRRGDGGFTLIELLVVVLVIGILSGIVVLAVSNSTTDAKQKACLANASSLMTALDVYKNTSAGQGGGGGSYMATTGSGSISVGTITYTAYTMTDAGDLKVLVPDFIKSLPNDDAETAVTAYVDTTKKRAVVKATGTACDGTVIGG